MKTFNIPTKEQLYEDYITNNLSPNFLTKKYGYSHNSSIYDLLKKYKITERQNNKIPKDKLEDLYLNQLLTMQEIADIYNISVSCVNRSIKRLGIKRRNNCSKIQLQNFSQEQLDIILGTLLGDGYMTIPKGCKNPNLQIEHTQPQLEYLQWLNYKLFPFSKKISSRIVKDSIYKGRIIKGNTSYRFRTTCHNNLLPIYKLCYPNKTKTVTFEWLNLLTPLSIAIWIMDDGTYSGKNLEICSGNLPIEQQEIICNYFNSKFGFSCKYRYLENSGYRIVFNSKDSIFLAKLIYPYFCPSMLYKIKKLI